MFVSLKTEQFRRNNFTVVVQLYEKQFTNDKNR